MTSAHQAAPAFVRLASHPLRWRLLTELATSDLRVRELAALTGEPQNLVSYHLRLLRDEGFVVATRSSFDGRDSYYHLDVNRCADGLAGTGAALHPALRLAPAPQAPLPVEPVAVLFVCTGNSARSPAAEALLRHHTAGRVAAHSAGTRPRPCLHPHTVRALRDRYGVDLSHKRPTDLNTLTGHRFDYVITLCDKARETCPEFIDQPRRMHWSIPDPAAAGGSGPDGYPAFLRSTADIESRIRCLLPMLVPTVTKENPR
ncbi:ArsR family transcriptional regulator [Micromonospora sp. NPDC126480]|uniref:arsenate reductase/protein-tyrosine-phosphatase family protein n=1 Tax=Micromonospora sp. NPDC126480 TaxID=3155312 RepID=UPI003324E77B